MKKVPCLLRMEKMKTIRRHILKICADDLNDVVPVEFVQTLGMVGEISLIVYVENGPGWAKYPGIQIRIFEDGKVSVQNLYDSVTGYGTRPVSYIDWIADIIQKFDGKTVTELDFCNI
jgi:hypothetical protein